MKKQFLLIGLLLVLVIVLFGSFPRITAQKTVAFDDIQSGACPELLDEYLEQSADRIFTPLDAQILTVSTIWGATECYILPCIFSEVNTVPENGQTTWITQLCMVLAFSEEDSLTARLCRIGVKNVHVYASPGENTLLSSKAEVHPDGSFDYTSGEVQIIDVPNCAVTPAVGVTFRAVTAASATEANEQNTAHFIWDFDVSFWGRPIHSARNVTVEYEYINNA